MQPTARSSKCDLDSSAMSYDSEANLDASHFYTELYIIPGTSAIVSQSGSVAVDQRRPNIAHSERDVDARRGKTVGTWKTRPQDPRVRRGA
ncbi:hypothetical protein PENSPDRAFT_647660 [Peniophora sp. CONT]|nr:hypothetical protein PENSPDRAFT_647660 [Peniophora sp. CONT]